MNPIVLLNRYELLSILGKGGQATVYRAHDRMLNVDRAIKVLSREMMRNNEARLRFEAEAKVMAQLQHPHVVRLYDIVSTPDVLFLVMDVIKGGTIWEWVRKYGPMPEIMVCDVIMDMVEAIGALHDAGIVHRDIKPSNMLVSKTGRLLITDFGIARFDKPEEQQTKTGIVMGTFGYMAPEQLVSARYATPRSDIFALGASIFALCTASVPRDLFMVELKPNLVADLSPPMVEIIKKTCAYEEEYRFQNTRELLDALQHCKRNLAPLPEGTVSLAEEAAVRESEKELPLDEESRNSITIPSQKKDTDTIYFNTEYSDPQKTDTLWLEPETSYFPVEEEEPIVSVDSEQRSFVRTWGLLVGAVLVCLVGAFLFWQGTTPENNNTSLIEAEAIDMKPMCVGLSNIVLERQKEDGGFSGIIQAGSRIWDTGQQLHSLQKAKACGVLSDDRWKKAKVYLEENTKQPHALDLAWAVLALGDDDKGYGKQLASYRSAEGGFYFSQGDKEPDWYTTLMALWALGERGHLQEEEGLQTIHYLNAKMDGQWWPGLDEQFMWIRLHLAKTYPSFAPSEQEIAATVQRMTERCVLRNMSCGAMRWPDTSLPSAQNRFTLSFQGHPWAIAFLSEWRRNTSYARNEEVEIMFQWLIKEERTLQGAIMGYESYRISEHVFALGVYAE